MLLLARHDGQEEIPLRQVAKDYFGLEPGSLEQKIKQGSIQISLPPEGLKNIRSSFVPLTILARYIQDRRSAAMIKMEDYAPNVSS